MLGIELTGVTLMVEAYHSKHGNDTELVKNFWEKWQRKVTEQVDLYLRYVEKLVASRIDSITGTEFNMFAYSPPVIINQQYSTPLILQEADSFAQELLSSIEGGNESSRGFVTVRIMNYPDVTQNLPSNITLQLQEVKSSKVYWTESIERRDGTTIPDRDFNTVHFELACYKFTVPYGTYKLGSLSSSYPKLLGTQDYNVTTTVTGSSRYGSQGVVAYSETINFYSEWKTPKQYGASRSEMHAATVDNSGNVYGLSAFAVVKFDSSGKIIKQWGTEGTGNSQFMVRTRLRRTAADTYMF